MHGRGVRGCVGLYRGNVLEDVDYVHLLGVPILINYIVQGLVLLSCVRYDLSGEVSITESFGYSPAHKHLLGRLGHYRQYVPEGLHMGVSGNVELRRETARVKVHHSVAIYCAIR